jgi:hypothetical protein
MNIIERQQVLLSAQSSLLGRVTDDMLAVAVSLGESSLLIRFILSNRANDELVELISEVVTEMISHLPSLRVSETVEVCVDRKFSVKEKSEILVFCRAFVEVTT